MKLFKYEATGNDFILLTEEVTNPSAFAREVCDRHFGIGADGLMYPSTKNGKLYMNYYNADGSIAPMCGNGIRAFSTFLKDQGFIHENEFDIDTLAGTMRMSTTHSMYTVNLGTPELHLTTPLYNGEISNLEELTFSVKYTQVHGHILNLGTIHLVVFVDDLTAYEEVASLISNHELFPSKINVNFVKVNSRNELTLRTYERGVGWTLSCGTGSSASAYVSNYLGKTEEDVKVHVPGGVLEVAIRNDEVNLTGPARKIAEIGWNV